MFPVGDGLVPSFPPFKDLTGILAHPITSCPSPLSFRPICLLSARFCLFSQPPPVSIPTICMHNQVSELANTECLLLFTGLL